MSQFILKLGASSTQFEQVDEFTRGYVTAMFFTDTGPDADPGTEDARFDQLAPTTLADILLDCTEFQVNNADALTLAYGLEYTAEQAGMDYWYTRNGHGTGYWDRELGWVGERLTDVAEQLESNLYVGDDGLLYLT
jgi:hypothetical protein